MRAKDLRTANELAQELRLLYRQRGGWDGVDKLQISGSSEAYGWLDFIEIESAPDILERVKAAINARAADLEHQLDALGVKDLWTLEEAEEDEDDDEAD